MRASVQEYGLETARLPLDRVVDFFCREGDSADITTLAVVQLLLLRREYEAPRCWGEGGWGCAISRCPALTVRTSASFGAIHIRHQKRLAVFYPDRLGTITTRIATGRNVIVVRSPAQVRAVAGPVRGSERRGKAGAGAILGGMG